MGRPARITEPGIAYHLLNRRVVRLRIFEKNSDYLAFERLLAESAARPDAPHLLAYCLMPNHWHLAVQAVERTNLSTWMQMADRGAHPPAKPVRSCRPFPEHLS